MIRRLHPLLGGIALALVASFWISSLAVEIMGDGAAILAVKTSILYAMILLIPAMAGAGATGFRLGAHMKHPLVAGKRRRMPAIALNGLLVLLPCAIFLQARAAAGEFDGWFTAAQGLELAAGALNIALLARSLRDGHALAQRRTRAA